MNIITPKRVLITGISGFIGCHLAKCLLDKGCEVHGIVRPGSRRFPIEEVAIKTKLHVDDGKTETLNEIIKTAQPEVVFHLATLFLASHETKDVIPLLESNVVFGARLLEAMNQNRVFCLVNTGTCWQNYLGATYRPVALYGATKQAFETLLEYYADVSPFRAITLKIFDTFGPNDPRGKLFGHLKKLLESPSPNPLEMSSGNQITAPLFIDDAVDAILHAANRVLKSNTRLLESYGIPGESRTLREIIAVFEEVSQKKLPVKWGARANRPREMTGELWNAGPPLPGWTPKTSFKAGVEKLLKS